MRKTRIGEQTCRCRAYSFPHRFSGGHCDGKHLVLEHWESAWGGGDCRDCPALTDTEDGLAACQVVDGAEDVTACPVWRAFVQRFEIILSGPRWLRAA